MFISNFKPDDPSDTSSEPYLKKREDTNLLNSFFSDESSKATLCENLLLELSEKSKTVFKTEFHLKWAMECIGYAFSLPARRYYSAIAAATKLYSDWLLIPEMAPDCIKKNREFYMQEMLCHYSLVFYPQKDTLKQSDIGADVMIVIRKLAMEHKLSEESWACLIKLMFLICRRVLANDKIVDLLGFRVVKTLFEVFVMSNTRNEKLWNEFEELLYMHFDSIWISIYWSSVAQGLTSKVIRLIHGESEKPITIYFYGPKGSNEVKELFSPDFDHEQTIYFWNRFLAIFIKKVEIIHKSPESRAYVVKGICKIVNLFLKHCDIKNSERSFELPTNLFNSSSPHLSLFFQQCYKSTLGYIMGTQRLPIFSISSLLDIFGVWLFEAGKVGSPFGSSEKADVLGVICKIFGKAQGPAQDFELNQFFNLIIEQVVSRDLLVISAICQNFLNVIQTGVKSLEFSLKTDSIIQIVSLYLMNRSSDVTIRRASYDLLSSFAPLASLYQLSGLSQQISDILFVSLGSENDEKCFETLVWTICSFLACCKTEADVVNGLLRGLADRLGPLDELSLASFYILLDAISLVPYLIDKNLIIIEVIKSNIKNLMAFIPKKGKNIEEQSCRIMQCVIDWIHCFPSVLNDKDLRNEVLRILENKKNEDKNYKSFNSFLKDCLMNNFGRQYAVMLFKNSKNNLDAETFLSDPVIFTQKENNDALEFCVKNCVGAYTWKIREKNSHNYEEDTRFSMNLIYYSKNQEEYKEEKQETQDINFDIEQEYKFTMENFKSLFIAQEINLKIFNDTNDRRLSFVKEHICKPLDNECEPKPQLKVFRKFISEMGYLDTNSAYYITPLDSSDSIFKEIDLQNFTQVIYFYLCYLPTPEHNESSIVSQNQNFSKEFQSLLNSLGQVISFNDEFPYFSREILKKYGKCVHKSQGLFEAVGVIPAIFSEEFSAPIEEVILKSSITVLWNERANDPYSNKIPNVIKTLENHCKAIILLTPISGNLVKINTFGLSSKQGPLIDKMIMSQKALPLLLLFTIYNIEHNFFSRYLAWKNRMSSIKDRSAKSDQGKLSSKNLLNIFE